MADARIDLEAEEATGPPPVWSPTSAPVQLVRFDAGQAQSGGPRLAVNEEARKAIVRAVGNRPVRVISVCGLYRTGKSLLLNLLAGTQGSNSAKGFAVGDSIRACTAGIWARASEPTGPNGTVCVLLDCEGSGSTDKDRDHDARLFALAVLISSYLVFNSRGVISESAVQSLAVAASLAEHVFRQNKDRVPGHCLSPSFLWVLRDFALALEDTSGNPITEAQYLENALKRPGSNTKGSDLSDAREKILDLFPRRDCATLVRPVDDEEDLQRLGALPMSAFRPKFLKEVEELRAKVLGGARLLRTPQGTAATGGTLLALVDAHIDAMNKGGVPQLGSVWSHVQLQECGRAVDEAMRVFSSQLLDVTCSMPMPEEDLEEALQRAKDAAYKRFQELVMGEEASKREHRAELDESIAKDAARLRTENGGSAAQRNEDWIRRRWDSAVEPQLKEFRIRHDAGVLTPEEVDKAEAVLKARIGEMQRAYMQEATGPEDARQGPLRSVAEKKAQVAFKEISSWRTRAKGASDARAAGERAGAEEASRLEAESEERTRQLREEPGGRGQAEAEPTEWSGKAKAQQGQGQGGAGGGEARPEERKQPKCCAVQ